MKEEEDCGWFQNSNVKEVKLEPVDEDRKGMSSKESAVSCADETDVLEAPIQVQLDLKSEGVERGECASETDVHDDETLMEPLFVAVDDEPSEETSMGENFYDTEYANEQEFSLENNPRPHVKHTPWNFTSQIGSSSGPSLSGDMAPVTSWYILPTSPFAKHVTLISPSLDFQMSFAGALCPRAHDAVGQGKVADTHLLEEHAEQGVAGETKKQQQEDPHFQKGTPLSGSLKSSTGEKPFKCGHCGKDFKIIGNLIQHERIHAGDQPFKCSACGKTFLKKSGLVMHLRTHTGERPYQCSLCSRAFVLKGHLTQHMRIHAPFKCTKCKKWFNESAELTSHVQTHFVLEP